VLQQTNVFWLDHVQSVSEGDLLPTEGLSFSLVLVRVDLKLALSQLQVEDVVGTVAGSEDQSFRRVGRLCEDVGLFEPELGVFLVAGKVHDALYVEIVIAVSVLD